MLMVEHCHGVDADAFGSDDWSQGILKHPRIAGFGAQGFACKFNQGWFSFAETEVKAAVKVLEAMADAGASEKGVGEGFFIVGHKYHRYPCVMQTHDKVIGPFL